MYLHSSEELVLTTQYLDDDNGSLSQPKLEVLPSPPLNDFVSFEWLFRLLDFLDFRLEWLLSLAQWTEDSHPLFHWLFYWRYFRLSWEKSHLSPLFTCSLASSEKLLASLRKSQACADRQLERHLWPGRSWFIKLKPIDDQAREDWLPDKRIYCRVLYILFCWLPWDRWPLHTLAGGGHGSSKYALGYTRIWSLWKKSLCNSFHRVFCLQGSRRMRV